MIHRATSLIRSAPARVRGHWSRRRHYARGRDWLAETYHRVAAKLPFPWPGRGRVVAVRLAGDPSRPLYVRLGTSDWSVVDEIFGDGREYDALLAGLPANVRQVVDLGANIGLSVRLWQRHFPQARIVAVEPDAANAELLRVNTAPMPGDDRPPVSVVTACAAGAAGTVRLDVSSGGGGAWAYRMTDAADAAAGPTVPAVTIPQLLAQCGVTGNVDLLKCDVEGAEREVFAACGDWIGRVRNLAVEVHPPYTAGQLAADVRRGGGRHVIRCDDPPGGPQVVLMFESPTTRTRTPDP